MKIKFFNTKHQIMCMLFFTYIYDLVRRGYDAQRRRHFERLAPTVTIGKNLPSHSCQSIRFKRIQQRSYERLFSNNSGDSWFKFVERKAALTSPVTHPESDYSINNAQTNHVEDSEVCPLVEMPYLLKLYEMFSHFIMVMSFIKYFAICVLQFEFVGISSHYACYIPGRLSFLFDLVHELPIVSLMVISCHIIYRYYLYMRCNNFKISCFLFISCDESTVIRKERDLKNHETSNDWTKLVNDTIFYQRVKLINGKVIYTLKANRSLKHWLRLKKFINGLAIFGAGNLVLWSVPLGTIIFHNLLSSDYFDANYAACRSFADRPIGEDFRWSFSDSYRFWMFMLDGADNLFLLFDSSQALVWPFATSVICTQDITFCVDYLSESVIKLSQKLRELSREESEGSSDRYELKKLVEREIAILQAQIVDIFTQIGEVDQFISPFTAYCVGTWVYVHIVYQSIAIFKKRILVPNTIIQYMQIIGLAGLTYTFTYLGRSHTKLVALYHKISTLVALDSNYKTTKLSWIALLEYFHQGKSRFTFHLGPSVELSITNYIKFMVWFVSCGLVMVNLLRHRLERVFNISENQNSILL